MGLRTTCSRPRPVVFDAKAKTTSLRGQGQGQYFWGHTQGQWSCWKNKKMTFLIKIHLLNWQRNVYQSTGCPQNWASVFTSYTNKLQSQVAITFKKHKLATRKYYKLSTLITDRWLEADASRPRPRTDHLEAKAKATILGPRAVLELEDSPRGPYPC